MANPHFPEPTLDVVMQKLDWGARQEAQSVELNPKEAAFVYELLKQLFGAGTVAEPEPDCDYYRDKRTCHHPPGYHHDFNE